MSKVQVKTTVNFQYIDESIESYRGVVLPGGTRSGKTIAVLQWLIYYCLQNTGKEIIICRDTLTNLKRTTLKDFQALCYGHGDYAPMYPSMKLNKAELTATINGNNIIFIGLLDDPMRVYGLRSDMFYINEAVATYKHTFNQLNQRCTEGWILDCNPSEPNSWVYRLEQRPDVAFFRTTYEDNPFLQDEIVKEIQSYEPTPTNIENGTADERMWSIYGRGEVFKGKEIIYPNWDTFDELPEGYDYLFYGLDWGHNHPLACTKVIVNGKDLYVQEVVYKSRVEDLELELAPILLKEPLIQQNKAYVVCDNTEHRSVKHLQRLGIPAMAVKKPPGSVLDGIRKVMSYNIHVHVDSVNIQNELNNYKWKVDTKTDSILDVPVKTFDDALDSIRYPLFTFL
jgi:phage terminase large subunit